MFLGTIARTMAQFALLMLMTIMPLLMLSGGMTPIESQPEWLQPITSLLPSRHYMAFAHAVVFRGAGLDIVWPQLLAVTGLGSAFLLASLLLFRSFDYGCQVTAGRCQPPDDGECNCIGAATCC